MGYPDRQDTIELLLSAARKAAEANDLAHPEDIACAMLNAIEYSWPVVVEAHKRFTQ